MSSDHSSHSTTLPEELPPMLVALLEHIAPDHDIFTTATDHIDLYLNALQAAYRHIPMGHKNHEQCPLCALFDLKNGHIHPLWSQLISYTTVLHDFLLRCIQQSDTPAENQYIFASKNGLKHQYQQISVTILQHTSDE